MRLESRPTIYSVYTKSVSKQTPNINVTGMRVPLDRCRRYACALCADHQAVSRQHEQLRDIFVNLLLTFTQTFDQLFLSL